MLPELTGSNITVDPQKLAIVDGSRRVTYQQLDQLVQDITNSFLAQGFTGQKKIAVIAKNSLNYFAVYLACKRSNNIAVLINWRLPPMVQESLLTQAEVSAVYRDSDLDNIQLVPGPVAYTCDPSQQGLFLYTSGTTGEPKAAVVTNANRQFLINRLHRLDPGVTHSPRIAVSPFYHMNGLSTIENIIAGGGTAIIMRDFVAEEFVKLSLEYRTSRMIIVPSMMAMVLDLPTVADHDWSFVRSIIMATSPVSRNLYDRAVAVFKNANVRVRYGLTEIGPVFGPPPERSGLIEPPLACGYPQPGVEYKLVNGVLHLRSASMSQGYYKKDNPKIVDGWLNTGDLFRIDSNGFYFWQGRADDQYKVGGEQVYPVEIELALENILGIKQACVVMLEDDVKGFKPYAFCTGKFNEEAVKAALLNTLPRYKIPRRIWLIDSMPLYGVGKIDRQQLTDRAKELL